jgi:hypothetical protein
MSAALFAALALMASGQDAAAEPPQDPRATTELEEVVVSRQDLRERTESFVAEVAGPPPRRGLARWGGRVCISVVNIRPDIARAVVDDLARLALELGLDVGEPGCTPEVMVLFTEDAPALARTMVANDPRGFHLGVGGLDRGGTALEVFQTSDAPVRWWHLSMPVVGSTGQRAIRMPGDDAPIFVPGEGRVNQGRPITDLIRRVIIVVDAERLGEVTLPQLNAYLGLVAFAQIDPEGDTRAYDTVLNLFDNPQGVTGLSDWDRVYLDALYKAPRQRLEPDHQAAAIARRLRAADRDEAPPSP